MTFVGSVLDIFAVILPDILGQGTLQTVRKVLLEIWVVTVFAVFVPKRGNQAYGFGVLLFTYLIFVALISAYRNLHGIRSWGNRVPGARTVLEAGGPVRTRGGEQRKPLEAARRTT